jgi:serine/threonine-protein kinase HipA
LLADGLGAALEELSRKGMKLFADLIAANLRQLLPVFGLPVPEAARERDAFVSPRWRLVEQLDC